MGGGAIAITLLISLAFGIALFFVLPLFLAQLVARPTGQGTLAQHLLEGAIRLAIFIGYLLLISRSREIQRVFQYHGAEHMSIHALDHGDPLTIEAIRRYPTAHERCGTEFLLVVVVVSILAFSLVGAQSLLVALAARLALIPVIVAASYEVLRWGARHRASPLVRWVYEPGIWLQKITTRTPDDSMIEVAVVSLEEALRADGEAIPAGSIAPARRPIGEPAPDSSPGDATSPAPGSSPAGPHATAASAGDRAATRDPGSDDVPAARDTQPVDAAERRKAAG